MSKLKLDYSLIDNIEKGNHVDTQHTLREAAIEKQKNRVKTTGKGWFDMPLQTIDSADLAVIKAREDLKRKRPTKGDEKPKFRQIGTVVDDALSFYSSRLTNKQRGHSLTDEFMRDEQFLSKMEKKQQGIKRKKKEVAKKYSSLKEKPMKKKKR
ncbi:deoxynucleotidyltransferase terminal-interacting protein 2 [Planoprotostelium fungivorum]|uniref:Deoxynucleotidyltransferase terminal-interacting protein 2 n=1 Tax=Planoprotostelium fungivorum TaxID=1890364 RepID=A0A2P6MZ82_9EUKA|nr:deoxynucleotidyltransferase terminal-interacting protein 2 [Planoprotostelium fungivorum]